MEARKDFKYAKFISDPREKKGREMIEEAPCQDVRERDDATSEEPIVSYANDLLKTSQQLVPPRL